jgi:beta-glucosidase
MTTNDPTGDSRRPWLDPSGDLDRRVQALSADLADEERAALALAGWSPLQARGLPFPHYVDAGSGLRGVEGATAFPAGIALAASFDPELAEQYGAAVGAEARAAGFSVLLGPALDLARDPRGGRVPEAFGEDPYLTGMLGAAHVRGVQSNRIIAQLKHYIAYNSEERRTGWGPVWQRGDAMDVRVSRATLEDVYLRPFRAAVDAGAWSIMGSYNRLNGEYVCQSPEILDIPRREWGWRGFYAPDFLFAVRDPAAAFAAGLDIPGLDGSAGRTAEMVTGRELTPARDEIVERVLRALIGSGLVDHPLSGVSPPSTFEHRDLARRAAVAGAVLLVNRDRSLPLGEDVRSVAVLGPSGTDALFTMSGSPAVTVDWTRAVTPLDGLRVRAGTAVRVDAAQGSWGDIPLPVVPAGAFTLPDRSGPGVRVERVAADGSVRRRIEEAIDFRGTADDIKGAWPRRWTAYLTSDSSGPHRVSLTLAGRATVRLDGNVVLAGACEAAHFIAGPRYALQGRVHLDAGKPVLLEIDYEVGPSILEPHLGLAPELRLGWQPPDSLLEEAVAAAAAADAAVVLVNAASGEGMDRNGLDLPGDQDELVARVAAVNSCTVVVLNTPGPVLMPWLDEVAAVLQVWYPGEQFGTALAAMIFGDEDPAGRLPLTFPLDRSHLPGSDLGPQDAPTELWYDEGPAIGYRSSGVRRSGALFPFGHGLGYASTGHEVTAAYVADDGFVHVQLRATNLGDRATVHVAQAYLDLEGSQDGRALVGVARIPLPEGASADAEVVVGPDAFLRYDPALRRRAVVGGAHLLRLAVHAHDPGETLTVEVNDRPLSVTRSTPRENASR